MTSRVPFRNRPGGEQVGWADVDENGEATITLFDTDEANEVKRWLTEGLMEGFSIGRPTDQGRP